MARLKGSNITKEFVPKVSLVSSTRYPIETLFAVWHNSRNIKSYPVKLLSEITGVFNKTLRIYDELTDEGIDELFSVSKEIHKSYPEYSINSEDEITIEDYISHAGYIITEVAKLCVKCDVPASESVSFTFVIDDASVAFREQLVRCLSGSTIIKLLDGTYKELRELVGKSNFYVYSYDIDKGLVVPGLVKGVQKTRTEESVLVEFDDGSVVESTWDHPFLTSEGTYVNAIDLEGKSVEPLYYTTNDKGYELIYQKGLSRNQYTHRMSKGKVGKNNVVHHIDKNKNNNDPTNLEELTYYEHTMLHKFTTESMIELWKNPEFREKVSKTSRDTMNKLWENPEFRLSKQESSRELMKAFNQDPEFRRKATEGVRKWFSDESNRRRHSEIMKNRDMSYLDDKEVRDRMSRGQIRRYSDPEERKKTGIATMNRFLSMSEDEYEIYCNTCRDSALLSWKTRDKSKIRESMSSINKREEVKLLQMRAKISKILKELLGDTEVVTEETYPTLSDNLRKKGIKPFSLHTILKYFESLESAIQYSKNYNHKVVRVIKSQKVVEFYDMEVEKYSNFAIKLPKSDSGVFVHNSKFASYWTTTSRTADLTAMDVNMDSKIADNPVAKKVYEDTVNQIRLAYSKLSELGIPTEDIRLSPECRVHRVDWIINLRALKPILSKRCLSGDTKIRLANGTSKYIKDIYEGESVWIYSFNTCTNKFEISKATSLGVTRKSASLVRVKIDNGEYIDCTLDHEFMMSDGTYKQAKDLDPEDSLMAMYTRLSDYKSMKGYEEVYDKYNDSWYYSHWISSDNLDYPLGKLENDFYVRHHKDFNKLNNDPNNIEFVPFKKHFKIHANSPESKAKAAIMFSNLWKDPQWREWKINSIKSSKARLNLTNYNKLEETRRKVGERNKRLWEYLRVNDKIEYQRKCNFLSEKAKKQWSDPDSSIRRSRQLYEYVKGSKICPICEEEYLVTRTYNISSKELVYDGRVTCSRSCAATYNNYGRYRGVNHKVSSIEYLDYTEDVYDLTTEDNHNFVVDLSDGSGVVVHNCDWLAQSTLWSPVVSQVLEILESIGISSEVLGVKPPVEYDTDLKLITYHKYDNENADRYYGKDPQPVDPLWLCNKGYYMKEDTDIEWYDRMKAVYIKLWNKDICDILGWDKDNPTKIGRYDRPRGYYTKETFSDLHKCIG